jgi:site-specific DNA-methyltransferase (adenine-specific)
MKPYFENEKTVVYNGDCLEIMKGIDDKSIDMVLCDLPYNTTANKWDCLIPLDKLWKEYKRICKDNAAIVLFSQIPFSIILGNSNLNCLRYEWIWLKEQGTGFLQANKAPLKIIENILVFYNSLPVYNPQMREGFKSYKSKQGGTSTNYNNKDNNIITENNGDRYPVNILEFPRDNEKLHPTQKPVELCKYLIKTYTNEGMTVLDNTAGSGTTGIAAFKSNRNSILIEKELEYCDIIKKRFLDLPINIFNL